MQAYFRQDERGGAVLDLRESGAAHRPEVSDLPVLTASERQSAVATWRGRMVNEHISAQVWSGLLAPLMAAAVPPSVLAGVAAAVADELRHAEQCAGVVLALGGEPVAPLPPLAAMPSHSDVGPLEGALRSLLSVGCLSETIAVAIIRAEHAELDGTTLGEVLRSILADEVQHARLGWRVLGLCAPLLDGAARQRLSAYLVDALAHQIAHELPLLPSLSQPSETLALAGVCDGTFARSLFFDTIEQVILPPLAAAGLQAEDAWKQALIRASTPTLTPGDRRHAH